MAVGGELQTLRELHKTLTTSSQQISDVESKITSSLGSTVWTGANSEKVRDAWEGFKPTLNPKLVQALDDAATDVKTQHNNLAEATGEGDRI